MSTETAPAAVLEVMTEETKQLAKIVKESSLSAETAVTLQGSFVVHFDAARKILEESRRIVVTDAGQKLQIKLAREYRLELRKLRLASDATRKSLKDESLRLGRAIDGFHNIFLHLTEDDLAQERLKNEQIAAAAAERERIALAEKKKADDELARIQKTEQDRKEAEVAAARLAAAAPDAEKVRSFANALCGLPTPELGSDEGKALMAKIVVQVGKFSSWLNAEADKLAPKPSDDLGF